MTQVQYEPISVGVPAGWVVLDHERQDEVDREMRDVEPALADLYAHGYFDWLAAVDLDGLPAAFSGLQAMWSCDDVSSAAARLERLRGIQNATIVDASVIELPTGEVATISADATVGRLTLRMNAYSYWAPTTTCDGSLLVTVMQSNPDSLLAEAIARSVALGSRQGVVTLELRASVVLPSTDFPVTCAMGGETGDALRISSGQKVPGMTTDLDVDSSGQPTFFQFANGTYAYFSGKGFDASEAFKPEPGSSQERGAATFEGITPPDDPAHPLSGRVTWKCPV